MQIVLVDASRVTLKLMTKMLNDNGHSVSAFADGGEAFAHLHSGADVDVLMTSFEIPSISGLQLCWEARLIANAGRP
ncbi:MAG: diguanylate cyclase response regulator, partial [Azorhizobium sp. 39-67-5]